MTPTQPDPGPVARLWLDLADLLGPERVVWDQWSGKNAESPGIDWYRLYALACGHFVAPALHVAVAAPRDVDMAPSKKAASYAAAPEDVRVALAEIYQLNAGRNRRLQRALRDTVAQLNEHGLEPLLLKGAIALVPGQHPDGSTRMMSDLDLALQTGDVKDADRILRSVGYHDADNIDPRDVGPMSHHLAPLFHPSGDGYVELHRTLLEHGTASAALPIAEVRTSARRVNWDGLKLWVPALEHRLLHNALHHQVHHQAYRSGRREFRQLLEFARLRAQETAQDAKKVATIDWHRRFTALDRIGLGDPVRAQFIACDRLFGQALPDGARASPRLERAEQHFWRRLDDRRLDRRLALTWQVENFARRLPNLPKRLVTPRWYPAKFRHLKRAWTER